MLPGMAGSPNSDHPVNLNISISWQVKLMVTIQDDGIGFDLCRKIGRYSGQGCHCTAH